MLHPFSRNADGGMFFHQEAPNVWLSLLMVLAAVDIQCLDSFIVMLSFYHFFYLLEYFYNEML